MHLRKRHPELVGLVRIRVAGRRGGARTRVVWGRGWFQERVGATTFRLPAACFAQVNTEMANELVDLVNECAGEVRGRRAIDLYGGIGIYGMELARRGAEVIVAEADGEAVSCGQRAVRDQGLERVRFARGDVGDFLLELGAGGRGADVVVANPPRSGAGPEVMDRIVEIGPSRVILVSCDPATLARDARQLVVGGYRAGRAVPVDLFPQTSHVETVLSLKR